MVDMRTNDSGQHMDRIGMAAGRAIGGERPFASSFYGSSSEPIAETKASQYLSVALGVIGSIASIAGIAMTALGAAQGAIAIVVVIIIDSVLLLAIGIYAFTWRAGLKRRSEDDANYRRRRESALLEDYYAAADALGAMKQASSKAIAKDKADFNYMASILSTGLHKLFKVSDRHYDDFTRIDDHYANAISLLANAPEDCSISDGAMRLAEREYMDNLKALRRRTNDACIHAHNEFMCAMLNKTKEMIEDYLDAMGTPTRVSVAVKSFEKLQSRQQHLEKCAEQNVFTSFRDTNTWEENKRIDTPGRRYSVARNTDFHHCLSGNKYFIFNNKSDDDTDFHLEGGNFGRYYNSGVTALIANEGYDTNPNEVVYGFLTCDVMNEDYPGQKVLNEAVAMIMMGASKLIAVYYSNLLEVWDYLDYSNETLYDVRGDDSVLNVIDNLGFWSTYRGYLDYNKRQREGIADEASRSGTSANEGGESLHAEGGAES